MTNENYKKIWKSQIVQKISSHFEYFDFPFFISYREYFGKTLHHPYFQIRYPATSRFSYLRLKLPLTERRFQSVDKIKENMMKQIMMIPKEDFTDCFETLKGYWDKMKTLKWTKTNGGYVFVDNN